MRSSLILAGACLLSACAALPATAAPSQASHTGVAPSAKASGKPAKGSSSATGSHAKGTKDTASNGTKGSASSSSAIRGVNLGGWLILEKWMNGDVFTGDFSKATDQWTFDSTPGAKEAITKHWDTYITEKDITTLAGWGINAVRIPIGYWAYKNSVQGPYITGADQYLEKAIGWCRSHKIKVLIDLHGSPGSQNGFDNSGHAGDVQWQSGDNMKASIDALTIIAKKYATDKYKDVVFAIEMVNEPISWGNNKYDKTQQWAKDAFNAVKKASTNQDLKIIMHDSFQNPTTWKSVSDSLNGGSSLADSRFWLDTHLYQNQVDADSKLDQSQHIEKACKWSSTNLLPSSSNLPVIVGEFSGQTNICANPDGSTVAGKTCTVNTCQCSSNVDIKDWKDPLVQATRKFLEAELDTFEKHAKGWFIWSYKGPGSWGLDNIMKYKLLGDKVTDRKYPGQCK